MTDLAYKSQANDSEITVLRPAVAVAGLTVAGTLFILRDLTAQRRSPAMSVFRTATTTTPK
jgi:50S ribosomal subunit-associated GTPase HflX